MIQHISIELIGKCKDGDSVAFEELVNLCKSEVFSFSYRLLCNYDDAQDATQETLIRVWQNIHMYNSKYKFKSWIYRIATNLCLDMLRKNKQDVLSFDKCNLLLTKIIDTHNPETELSNNEIRITISCISASLSPKQRVVFTLKELEDFSVDEIRKITRMTGSQIKSNLYLARKQIKTKLKDYGIR